MHRRLLPALLVAGLAVLPAQAQFWDRLVNPDVEVTVNHPPALGIKAQRVAFAPVANRMAEDLVAACISDLAATGQVEIVDRGNLEKALAEQKLSNSGLIDESTAVAMGKLLGSPILLFVKVLRADAKHVPLQSSTASWTDKKGGYHPSVTTYVSRTQVEYNATVQAIDLATGKVYSQQRAAFSPSRENSSDQGRPEYPSETEVMELAVGMARQQVHTMLLPWTERRKLIFYDDKDYGMKEAYRQLQLNDTRAALVKSLEALEAAQKANAKPKYLGRTNYNVGMCKFILGDYTAALPYLHAARATDPGHKIFASAEEECLRAKGLAEEMGKVDARTAQLELAQPKAAEAPAPAPAAKAAGGATAEERLARLEELRKKKVISPAEYKAKRAEIMKDL